MDCLKGIKAEDIAIGEEPEYFYAYMECNSTGVGESSFGGTTTQRTVALDYKTDEFLFIDGHVSAGQKGLEIFLLKPGETINFYKKDDIVKVAKTHGFNLHMQYFRDLNFRLTDHRLNRYTVKVTHGPTTYPIRPILAKYNDKGNMCTIGYLYEKDGMEYIIIEPADIDSDKDAFFKKTGCAPWMFLGFLFPPIFLVAIFVMLVKYYKERFLG